MPSVLQSAASSATATRAAENAAHGRRTLRYALHLPKDTRKSWASSSTSALKSLFGSDELGRIATALFQSALTEQTKDNYSSNLSAFYKFCGERLLDPLTASPIDIARYVAWLGQRGTIAAGSLQPYLSAVNRLLHDHAQPPVALGPLVARFHKGLENCQEDTRPLPWHSPS